jgi:hypothetical protein
LRSAIPQVGGKKQLTGRTDVEIEISNQCGRLISTASMIEVASQLVFRVKPDCAIWTLSQYCPDGQPFKISWQILWNLNFDVIWPDSTGGMGRA